MKKHTLHFIAQTHWDREWYFTIDDSSLLSTWNFEKIIETLENDKEFKSFNLDGQVSIIEDCIRLRPDLKQRIKKLVQEKRLFIGPWYTQTDSFYVDGESFIRNIYFGSMIAEEYGHSMKVGYLPDTFGHNVQTPQLLKGFGINNILFWRGFDPDVIKDSHFNWKSIDGSEILAINLRHGYGDGGSIKDDHKQWDEKIIPMINKTSEATKYENIVMCAGGDQSPIIKNLPKIVGNLNQHIGNEVEVKISNWEDYMSSVMAEVKELSNLQEYVGEMREPRRVRVHRTIGSSRYDLKKKSFELEHKLINILEPLSIIVKEVVDDSLNNNELLKQAWKLLLDGHAHDSLGACNTDMTNENIINRFKRAENLIDGTINLLKKVIGENIQHQHGLDLVLYNFDTKAKVNEWKEITLHSNSKNVVVVDGDNELETKVIEFEEISGGREIIQTQNGDVEVDIPPYYNLKTLVKVNLPSFGYKSFKVKEIAEYEKITVNENVIENEFLKLIINNDQIDIFNKKNDILIKDFVSIENVANDGDSYDFSPIENDSPITDWKISNVKTKNFGDNISTLKFSASVSVPFELKGRNERSENYVNQEFEVEIILNERNLDFKLNTVNIAKDHRFRLKFANGLTNIIKTDVPFGYLKREYKEIPSDWKERYVEMPVNYFPIINTFYSTSNEQSILCHTKGIKEIEIDEENNIYLTLYKADGFLGKNDLVFRPNRASGINNVSVPTPGAQLFHQPLEFEFQISFDKNDITELEVTNSRERYLSKFDYYHKQNLDTFKDRLERFSIDIDEYVLEVEVSLLETDKLTLVSSYISHKDQSNIFRFVNMSDKDVDKDEFINDFGGQYINFAEDPEENIKGINKYKLVTIKK